MLGEEVKTAARPLVNSDGQACRLQLAKEVLHLR
jgi:hypothetical protein